MNQDWIIWIQTTAAIITALAAPQFLTFLWKKLQRGLTFTAFNAGLDLKSSRWSLSVEANIDIVKPTNVFVYGKRSRTKVIDFSVMRGGGQGVALTSAISENGDLSLIIDRMPKGALITGQVVLSRPSAIRALAVDTTIREGRPDLEKAHRLFGAVDPFATASMAQRRVMLVAAQFMFITMILCVRLLYLGLSR